MTSIQPSNDDQSAEQKLDEMLLKAELLARQMKIGCEATLSANSSDVAFDDKTPTASRQVAATPEILQQSNELLHRIAEAREADAISIFADHSTAPGTFTATPALLRQTEALLALMRTASPEKKAQGDSSPILSMNPRVLATPHQQSGSNNKMSIVTPPESSPVAQAEELARLMQETLSSLQSDGLITDLPEASSPERPVAVPDPSIIATKASPLKPESVPGTRKKPPSQLTSDPPQPRPSSSKSTTSNESNGGNVKLQSMTRAPTERPKQKYRETVADDPHAVPISDYVTPNKLKFREGDDLLKLADLSTRSPTVKWEKVSNASFGDKDYVPLKDFRRPSPTKPLTRSAVNVGGAVTSRRSKRRRRKKMLRVVAVILFVALLVYWFMGTRSGVDNGSLSETSVDVEEESEASAMFHDEHAAMDDIEEEDAFAWEEETEEIDEVDSHMKEEYEMEEAHDNVARPACEEESRSAPQTLAAIAAETVTPTKAMTSGNSSLSSVERGHLEKKIAQWTRAGLKRAAGYIKQAAVNLQPDLRKAGYVAADEILPSFNEFTHEWKSMTSNNSLLRAVRKATARAVRKVQNRLMKKSSDSHVCEQKQV